MESNGKDLQGEFFPRGPFTRPLACGQWQYVPILKSMPGELAAIDQAPGSVLDRMTPLIEVDERITAESPKGRSRTPRLVERLAPTITADRPFFIDFPWMESDAQVLVGPSHRRTAVNAMELVLGECRNHGLQSIPVLASKHDGRRLAIISNAAKVDKRGMCLRVPLLGVVFEGGPGAEVERLRKKAASSPEETDVLLDLGYVGPTPGVTAEHLVRIVDTLPNVEQWRSLVLSGTVIPSTAAGWEEWGITEIERNEWRLWTDVIGSVSKRQPSYGDYAVQHPEPPDSGGPGMRGSVRYTTEDLVLFARGGSILEFGAEQYRDLCNMLIGRPEFAGANYSWGDRIIDATAKSAVRPAGEPRWRAAGTSHHLQRVTDSLSGLESRARQD
jgi:hypothetical protein